MKHRIKDANNYYRKLYPEDVIFYKLPAGYTVFGCEAVKLSHLLGIPFHDVYGHPSITIPASEYFDKTEILNMCGKSFRAVSYFDDNGVLSIPDIQRLAEEEEIDY